MSIVPQASMSRHDDPSSDLYWPSRCGGLGTGISLYAVLVRQDVSFVGLVINGEVGWGEWSDQA